LRRPRYSDAAWPLPDATTVHVVVPSSRRFRTRLVTGAPTSRIVIGHIGVDRVGTGLEIVSVRSLAGSLDPLLFCLELLTLGPGGEFLSLGLLPLCFKVPSSRLVAVFLRLAPPLFGRDRRPAPHDDDSTRHDGDDNDSDHDDDNSGHVHERTPHPDPRWATTLSVQLRPLNE